MKINIVDGDTIIYIAVHNKKGEPEKTLQDCYSSIDLFFKQLFINTECTHYIIYLTIDKCFRYRINPDYKSGRKSEKPKFFFEARQYLIDKWGAVSQPEYESDDLCAFTRAHFNSQSIPCFISSSDKDIKMLEGTTYDYLKWQWRVTDQQSAKEYLWASLISGDSVDTIKGIPKRGGAYASKVFHDSTGKIRDNLEGIVLVEYIKHFGEYIGVQEFYKNYMCLKLVTTTPQDFVFPEPIQVPEFIASIDEEKLFTEN